MTMIEASALTTSEVNVIVELMAAAQPGTIISYDEITAAIGRDAVKRRHSIVKAMRHLQREKRVVFAAVNGVGYQRLDSAGIVDAAAGTIAHIRRTSKKGVRKLACVDYGDLDQDQKVAHNTRMTVLALVAESVSSSSVKRVEQKVVDSNAALPAAKAAIAAIGPSIA